MLDPRGIYELDEQAVARLWPTPPEAGSGPVLLHAVSGFGDAGRAG